MMFLKQCRLPCPPLSILLAFLSVANVLPLATGQEPSPPKYEYKVERNVRVRMRDGVHLATDLYIPMENGRPLEGKIPAVLARSPYDKTLNEGHSSFFAQHGYLAAAQDCRGRFESEGEFFPFVDDPEDGYDTIEWLAKHPLCNGKVGMHGPSYLAWVQFEAASLNPPSLVTMIPFQGPINAYHYSMRVGGALHLGLLQWVVKVAESGKEAKQDPLVAKTVATMSSGQSFLYWASRIPWERGTTPLATAPTYEDAAFQLYFENNDYTDFWRQPGLGMDEYFDSFPDMPILWVTSWFDWYPRTISDGYQKMVKLGRKNQYLLCGPWTHSNFRSVVGDVDFGSIGFDVHNYDDFLQLELRWFDRWLKDDVDADIGQPVRLIVMGGGDGRRTANGHLNHGGQWHHGEHWPFEGVQPTHFYLRQDGTLSSDTPTRDDSSTTYAYDPTNTVSSNGRCIVSYGQGARAGFSGMGPRDQIDLETLPGHGYPGKPIVERPDVIHFQTPVLTEDVRIAGNIQVRLWCSSDAPDTDFYVKLLDIHPPSDDYPNGYSFPVSEGILRARFRQGFEKPTLMKPDEIYQLEFPLEPAANLYKAGHRIGAYICSSNFPNFDINPNTGDPNDRRPRIAHNTIHHDANHPSSIVLPVDTHP